MKVNRKTPFVHEDVERRVSVECFYRRTRATKLFKRIQKFHASGIVLSHKTITKQNNKNNYIVMIIIILIMIIHTYRHTQTHGS